jgi:4-amino-4-deoxy-L-arabinose transferase-like glycosyltransferase
VILVTWNRRAPWLTRIFMIALLVFVAVVVVLSYVRPERRPPAYVSVLFAVAFVLAVGFGWLWPVLVRRRVRRLLAARQPLDAATFGETYFRDLPRGPELAAVVRRRLEDFMGLDLSGLRPDDRLKDVAPEVDPSFFEELAQEFGYRLPEHWPEFFAQTSSVRTVRDLVEYVAQNAGPGSS